MPRNRTARLAVLGSSLQRSPSAPHSSRTGTALRRRLVVGLLVVASLVLITAYFRESDTGGLHDTQGVAASLLRPFEVGADRVARPFRDAYGSISSLFAAKADARRLRRENELLRREAALAQVARVQNRDLRRAAHFVGASPFLVGYRSLTTSVIAQPEAFDQQLVINAGFNAGIRKGDAVITPAGLVGIVTLVHSHEASVALLTDESSAASAADQRTGARGIVKHEGGANGSFQMKRVFNSARVRKGDRIVTAGWRVGSLTPLYPIGIPLGVVSHVYQRDTDYFKRVQVDSYVDFSKLDTVTVLLPGRRSHR